MPECPILLLDVDGVVAPLGDPPQDTARPYAVIPEPWPGPVWYYPDITGRLARWHSDGFVELQWLTTWREMANRLLAGPFGFGALHTHTLQSSGAGWWKAVAAQSVLESTDRRVVWCDDHLLWEDRHGEWANQVLELEERFPSRLLTICPPQTSGLLPEHLDQIEEWVGSGPE